MSFSMDRVILHVDMDAFYASVEQLDNPSLRGKPVIVGGTSDRGVVSAASYEARSFGVQSAMPIFRAREKCPEGIFLPVRMARYKEISREFINVLKGFSPLVEQISVDEAYLDLSGTRRLYGEPEKVGRAIKARIRERTRLCCSIGIAPNKFLAKIASDMKKPDGFTVIRPEELSGFVAKLPIEKVPGVGQKKMEILRAMGVSTLGDVLGLPEKLLLRKAGKFGKRIMEFARGIDTSPVIPWEEVKSVSSEDTLPRDTKNMAVLRKQLLSQSEIVGRRLRNMGLLARTITLKLKRSDFKQITRSTTLGVATDSTDVIYRQGVRLLEILDKSRPFRLIGIGASTLSPVDELPEQLRLFGNGEEKTKAWREVEDAMDEIKERFGAESIYRGDGSPS